MRKASIIAMAALALLTAQCKKNEPKPEEKVMVPITGSVDFGGSKTEITTTGMIYPKDGDVIYIYYNDGSNVSNVGSMTCTAQSGSQQFTCSGTINVNCLGKTCTFMYLGSNNGTNGDSGSISFVDQTGVSVIDGKISGLEKFHVGSCQAQVSADGKVTLPMATKMSIAYFKLTDGTNPIANRVVTISGVYATANIDKENGTISYNSTGNITVKTNAEGKFYMALVPQSGPVTFNFAVEGYENATNEFPYGIRECSFYSDHGSGSPLPVTMEVDPSAPQAVGWTNATSPKAFSVSSTQKVYFSQGNLQWSRTNGTSANTTHATAGNNSSSPYGNEGTWRFAEHQFDYIGSGNGNISSTYNGWIDLFGWATSGWNARPSETTCYYMPYETSTDRASYGPPTNIYDLTGTYAKSDWGVYNDISNDGTLSVGAWRTLTGGYYYGAEWQYLLRDRTNASTLCGKGKVENICGLIILPDDFNWTSTGLSQWTKSGQNSNYTDNVYTYSEWHAMETEGAVFLPAAGYRQISTISDVGTSGYYWSVCGTCEMEKIPRLNIYYMEIKSSNISLSAQTLEYEGLSVRLVRDAN